MAHFKITAKTHLLSITCHLLLAFLASAQTTGKSGPSAQPPRSSPESSTVVRSTGPSKYGYPYLVAPTLSPLISSRSDDYDNEAEGTLRPKPYGSKLAASEESMKKISPKKYKPGLVYGASRRHGLDLDDSPMFKKFRSYKEPKYRNFEELESAFLPRRIDYSGHYSPYDYAHNPSAARPPVSPRDPYLSPTNGPSDGFYPLTDVKSYSPSYASSGPIYGAGKYEDSYYDDHTHSGYDKTTYSDPPKYPTSSHYHEYQEDYAIESNKPITGDVRKRLLDYAGASDLYEGEPDYLQEVARNKNKYGYAANDYYAYGGPGYRSSYREYPYVESKVRIIKKTLS